MKYTVHSNAPGSVPVEATTEAGVKVMAEMPVAIVELVPDNGGPTLTINAQRPTWAGLAIDELFAVGNVVVVGFTLVSKAEPATAG